MAKKFSCIGVDIGAHSIRVAELERSGDGIEIKKLVEKRLQFEPDQSESKRQAAIATQLKALLKENGIKTKSAVFCVPGQTAFIRQIRLPATDPERLARIIHFEAREQIPFPLEKTVLEYQVFDSDDPREVQVLLVAIRRDYINPFMNLVEKSGLKKLAVSVSSLALHNFYEVNACGDRLISRLEAPKKDSKGKKSKEAEVVEVASEDAAPDDSKKKKRKLSISLGRFSSLAKLGKRKKKKGEPEPSPVAAEAESEAERDPYDSMEMEEIQANVNLGASWMDLSIPKAGEDRLVGFTRTVPVAGNQMDRRIGQKLGLASLEDAQRIKEQECAILSADFSGAGDQSGLNLEASSAATTGADNIITEVRRSLEFYIAQPDGVAVDTVILSGGLARMKNLPEYFEEKMGTPVSLASITNSHVKVDPSLDSSVVTHVIPIGLAFQGLGAGQVDIDFLPQEIKNLRTFKSKRAMLAAATVIVFLTAAIGSQAGTRYFDLSRAEIKVLNRYIQENEAQSDKIKSAESDNKDLGTRYKDLGAVRSRRALILEFVADLLEHRPGSILIERLEVQSHGVVLIQGRAPQQQAIIEFFKELESADEYVKKVELTQRQNAESDSRFTTKVFPFQMRVTTFDQSKRYRSIRRDASGGVLQALAPGAAPKPKKAEASGAQWLSGK